MEMTEAERENDGVARMSNGRFLFKFQFSFPCKSILSFCYC